MSIPGRRLIRWTVLIAAPVVTSAQDNSPETLLRSAVAAARSGSIDKTGPLFLSALDAARIRSGGDDLAVSNVLHEYGLALRMAGQASQGAKVLTDALAIRDRELPADHSWIAFTAARLARAQFALQRYDDAPAANLRAAAQLLGRLEAHRADATGPRHGAAQQPGPGMSHKAMPFLLSSPSKRRNR